MKLIIMAAAMSSTFALSPAQGLTEDVLERLTQNAIAVEGPGGQYMTYFSASGRYTTDVGIHGHWEVRDGDFCVTRDGSTDETCQPLLTNVQLGDQWTGENAAGDTVVFTLVPRR